MLIYDRIKTLCDESGTNIFRLEKKAGIGNGTIGKWRTSAPSMLSIQKVADALGMSIDELVGDIVIPENKAMAVKRETLSYTPVWRDTRRAEMFSNTQQKHGQARLAGMPRRFDAFDIGMSVVFIFIPILIIFIGGLFI